MSSEFMPSEFTRRERKKMKSRDRIVNCATALFVSRGYDATTMEDIGECADVSRATVFNYFPRKEDLVLAWFDDRRTDLAAELAAERDLASGTSVVLRKSFRTIARFFEDDPETGRGMVRSWLQAGGPLLTPDSDTTHMFAAIIRAGQNNGDIAKGADPDHAAQILFDAYQGQLIRWATGEDKPSDLEHRLFETLDLILGGITAQKSPG